MKNPSRVTGTTRRAALYLSLLVGALLPGATFAQTATVTTLYTLSSSDGNLVNGNLVQGPDGHFYGTAKNGGAYGKGTLFQLKLPNTFTKLRDFGNGSDGAYPLGSVAFDSSGNLYSTTSGGGAYGTGTVFEATLNSSTPTALSNYGYNSFVYDAIIYPNLLDGKNPAAGMIRGSDGNFYGTTANGGTPSGTSNGNVFKMAPGKPYTTVTLPATATTSLYTFGGATSGYSPQASLFQARDGYFYGTTYSGPSGKTVGTVFKISSGGTFTSLYSFASSSPYADGGFPMSSLVQGASPDDSLYGTTHNFGASGGTGVDMGTVFKLTQSGGVVTYNVLHTFTGVNGEGYHPYSGLVLGSDGNFYGTTQSGGARPNGSGGYNYTNAGTLFQIKPDGTFTTLYAFGGGSDGGGPVASLVQGSDGVFYGATADGGSGNGTLFKMAVNPVKISSLSANNIARLGGGAAVTVWLSFTAAQQVKVKVTGSDGSTGTAIINPGYNYGAVTGGMPAMQSTPYNVTYSASYGDVTATSQSQRWTYPTTTTLTSSANPSTAGQSITLTAQVTSSAGTPLTGGVTFFDGTTTLQNGLVPNASGIVTFTTSALSVGSHSLRAVYNGDTTNYVSTGSLTQVVN